MTRIVIIDASPLIGLAIVDGLKWLPDILGTVFLTETVKQEVLPGKAARGKEAIAVTHQTTTPSPPSKTSFRQSGRAIRPACFASHREFPAVVFGWFAGYRWPACRLPVP